MNRRTGTTRRAVVVVVESGGGGGGEWWWWRRWWPPHPEPATDLVRAASEERGATKPEASAARFATIIMVAKAFMVVETRRRER